MKKYKEVRFQQQQLRLLPPFSSGAIIANRDVGGCLRDGGYRNRVRVCEVSGCGFVNELERQGRMGCVIFTTFKKLQPDPSSFLNN